MNRLACTFAAILSAALLHAAGAAAFDLSSRSDLGCERPGLLSRASGGELVAWPVAGISYGETTLDLGGVRRYELSEFDQMYLAAAHRHRSLTFAAGMSQLGDADFYAEQTAALAAAVRTHALSIGATWSARRIQFGAAYGSLSAMTVGLSAAFRADRIAVGIQGDNLTEPRFYPGAVPLNDRYTLRLELTGPGRYLVAGRVTIEQRERPRCGLTHRLDPIQQASLFWSIATAPLTFAGGFDIMYSGSRLSYTASYHPTLGLSHLFSIGWTFGGKRT